MTSATKNEDGVVLLNNAGSTVTGKQQPTEQKVPRMLKELQMDDPPATENSKGRGSKGRSMDSISIPGSKRRQINRGTDRAKTVVDNRFHHTDKLVQDSDEGQGNISSNKTGSTASSRKSNRSPREPSKYTPDMPALFTRAGTDTSTSREKTQVVDRENLLTKTVGETYDHLSEMDKHLHNLQKGAPSDSTSLTFAWTDVAYNLVKEKYFTNREFKQWGGLKRLKERYNEVRHAVQGAQAATEPKSKKDQPVYWAEDFDVFDQVGSRTVYVNKRIPQSMYGEERFTLSVLREKQRDLVTFRQNLDKTRNDFMKNGLISGLDGNNDSFWLEPDASQASITLTDPAFSGSAVRRSHDLKPQLFSGIRKQSGSGIVDPQSGNEEAGYIPEEYLDQTKIADTVLTTPASAVSSERRQDLGDLPAQSRPTVAAHSVPTANTTPLAQEEQYAQSVASARVFVRNASRNQRQQPTGLRTESTNPAISGQTDGETNTQIQQSPPATWSGPCFVIHEDSSGSTPKNRRHAASGTILHDTPKENFEYLAEPIVPTFLAATDMGFVTPSARRRTIAPRRRALRTPRRLSTDTG